MPDFPTGSSIGEPDIVVHMDESYFIEGNYKDDWRCFIIKLNNSEPLDLSALEFIPGNLEAVHHSIIVAVNEGDADYLDNSDPDYGYECYGDFGNVNTSDFLGGYAPGTLTRKWPQGLAQRIPANSDLIMQIHYAPSNTDQTDQRYLKRHLLTLVQKMSQLREK